VKEGKFKEREKKRKENINNIVGENGKFWRI
jgi:hypothetical protein